MSGPISTGPIQAHVIAAGKYHDIDFARLEILKLMAEEPRIRATVAMDYANTARLADCEFLVTYTCDVIPTADEVAALKATRALVTIGHASGWDMLAGFIAGAAGCLDLDQPDSLARDLPSLARTPHALLSV